jgi:hypothetical protein
MQQKRKDNIRRSGVIEGMAEMEAYAVFFSEDLREEGSRGH